MEALVVMKASDLALKGGIREEGGDIVRVPWGSWGEGADRVQY